MADERTERADWHVLTRTRGGTVSLIKNLTLRTAVETRKRLPCRWEGMSSGGSYTCSDGDIEQSEIIGPDGWDGCKGAFTHEYGEWGEWTEGKDFLERTYLHRRRPCLHCDHALYEDDSRVRFSKDAVLAGDDGTGGNADG